jgi:peptidoglycan hydrolase-like protein with peptidoglycan-binding domain
MPKAKTKLINNGPFGLSLKGVNLALIVVFVVVAVTAGAIYVGNSHAASFGPYQCDSLRTLSYGSYDTSSIGCVHSLQWALNENDYSKHSVGWPGECGRKPYYLTQDGRFGSQTLADVKRFQQYHYYYGTHLTVDGIVGPKTWWALMWYRPYYNRSSC